MSSGTNAYTADDHTNYTFSSGSAEGLKKLVPVFLDHILHPRIEPETVDMEVFSLKVDKDDADNPRISAQGVVYCEMKSRQNSEADLLDFNLRRQICRRLESVDPVFSRFKWECGGLTRDIATLSVEDIINFHKLFYNPSKMSIIICGRMNESLEKEILSLIDSVLKTPENYVCIGSYIPLIEDENLFTSSNEAKIVNFPSNEDNLGSIGLAWRGAFAKDLTKVLSFHVIFKYLRETSSSPLYQNFVQIENPWATDIDYEIKPLYHTIMTLIFSGVPNRPDCESSNGLAPNLIKSMLKKVLKSLMEDMEEFGNSIKLCLSSFELKLIELIEDDPYETINSYTIPELIVSSIDEDFGAASSEFIFGGNIYQLKKIICELKEFSIDYWLSLLQFLIDNEPAEVVMVPDVELNDKIEKEEQDYLKNLWESSKARVSKVAQVTPYKIDGDFEVLKDSHLTPFRFYNLPSELRAVELPGTGMKQIVRLLNFKDFIPDHLWPYLVLYQELLFQCDVDLSVCETSQELLQHSSVIPYQSLQKILNSKFNSYGINFGLENETFSLGYCEDAMSLNATLPSSTSDVMLKDAIKLLETIATCSLFIEERVKIVAENLYNQIQDVQKDPYEVTEAILTLCLHEMSENATSSPPKKAKIQKVFETEISIFKQKTFLKKISRDDVDSLQIVLQCLNQISESVKSGLKEGSSFVQIGSSPSALNLEEANLALKMTDKSNFDVLQLPKFGDLTLNSGLGIAYAIGDINASYLSFVIPCKVLPSNSICEASIKNYVGISLICQLLSVTEGPIYSAIRGRGLAYDASLTVSVWNGLLTFAVNDSNDPVAAFIEFQRLMNKINDEFLSGEWDVINEDSLKVAKSAFLYQMIEESATPSSMFNTCLRNYLRSISMAYSDTEENLVMRAIHDSSLQDLKAAWFEYFPKLLSKQALSVLIVPKSIAEDVLNRFEGIIDFELKTFNDFSDDPIDSDSDSDSDSYEEDIEESDSEEISDIDNDDDNNNQD